MEVLDYAKILVVDGGSKDRTVDIAKELGAEVLIVAGGKGVAISEALNYLNNTLKNDLRYVVFTDADYTYPASAVPDMIRILEDEPHVGAVLGNRFHQKAFTYYLSDIYLTGNVIIKLFYKAFKDIKLNDPLSGLRVVRWESIRDWKPKSKGFEIETEMNIFLLKSNWEIKEVPIDYRSRIGEKKLKVKDAFPILRTLLTYDGT